MNHTYKILKYLYKHNDGQWKIYQKSKPMTLYKKDVGVGKVKITGGLSATHIKTRIENNIKVTVITSIITLISIVIGFFIPYIFVVAGISVVVWIVTTFFFPPTKERIIEKKEVL